MNILTERENVLHPVKKNIVLWKYVIKNELAKDIILKEDGNVLKFIEESINYSNTKGEKMSPMVIIKTVFLITNTLNVVDLIYKCKEMISSW